MTPKKATRLSPSYVWADERTPEVPINARNQELVPRAIILRSGAVPPYTSNV
jgi:hypothetical protein